MNESGFISGYADIEGACLYYEVTGQGPYVVLVHAGIADRRMWDDQFEVFSPFYRLVRFDMRGFGKSPMTTGPYSNRQDLMGLLSFLGISRASFIGCSMGGMTVIDFAFEHPEMVRSMVLVSTALSGFNPGGAPPPQIFDLIEARKAGDFERAADLQVQIWVDGFKRGEVKAAEPVRDKVRRMGLDALVNQRDFLQETGFPSEIPLQPPAIDRLNQLDIITMVLAGALDDDSVMQVADLLVEKLPYARKETIVQAAHLINLEKPDEFNRIALAALGGLPPHIK